MPVSAEVLRRLIAAGVTGDALVGIVEAIDVDMETVAVAKPRSAAAIRQERYRARHQEESVTRDVTGDASRDVTADDGKETPRPPRKNYLKKTNTAPAREARIDPDWEPSETDVEAVTSRGLPPDQLPAEVVAFREHHLGVGTASDDFGALFRGWCRNGLKHAKPARSARVGAPGQGARASPPPADDGPKVQTKLFGRMSAATLLADHEAGRWRPGYGPPPGEPDCPIAAYLPKTSPEPIPRAAE